MELRINPRQEKTMCHPISIIFFNHMIRYLSKYSQAVKNFWFELRFLFYCYRPNNVTMETEV